MQSDSSTPDSRHTTTSEGLRRALRPRHLSMFAIGGSIGSGLFLASGATVAQAGPGGALLAFALVGVMVYFIMLALGEMSAAMPLTGSFSVYGSAFVDEGLGFAMGWNYSFNWAVSIAADLVAAQIVMGFWFPDVPGAVWSALFLALMFLLNAFSVRGFGESEFWFALIKVLAVIAFLALGFLLAAGLLGTPSPGLANWTLGEAPFAGGLPAVAAACLVVGFSFQGTELFGIAAGETADPGRAIPRAAKDIFWRVLFFYLGSITVIGFLIPYTDPRLLQNDVTDVAASPFTLVFSLSGLPWAAALMNAVILTAILSAGNSGMFASTRMLYTMAREGKAPRWFGKTTKAGVPLRALLACTGVSALCFLSSVFSRETVYLWLLALTGMGGFMQWLGITAAHWRFRKAWAAQGGRLEELPFRSPFHPWGSAFSFAVCFTVMMGQGWFAVSSGVWDWRGLLATYIGIPAFLTLWWGWRTARGSRLTPCSEIRFPGGLRPGRGSGSPS